MTPLSYSDGLQYSVPGIAADGYDKWNAFLAWASGAGRRTIALHDLAWSGHAAGLHGYGLLDLNRDGSESTTEQQLLDASHDGRLSDDERDEDADGLSNMVEAHNQMQPQYWTACYPSETTVPLSYAGTSPVNADTDGDGIRDVADDSDFDGVPNLMELSRFEALGGRSPGFDETDDGAPGATNGGGPDCKPDPDLDATAARHPDAYGQVDPFNPCLPVSDPNLSGCPRYYNGTPPAPITGPRWWALQ